MGAKQQAYKKLADTMIKNFSKEISRLSIVMIEIKQFHWQWK